MAADVTGREEPALHGGRRGREARRVLRGGAGGGTLIGTATLWGIDTHNRSAHIGIELLPSARGKGYGTDVVGTLCHYGFVVRSLQRLQIETLADNAAMLGSAERNGFVREGVLRSSAWVLGEFLDEVLLGLLVKDWKPDA
ncbi:hypothetical protein Smic_35920 [Streptomyces microflavus]|uniref:N-acetyltransferase domain-containing protein n=1 Tax=Streptomyces microflavus TaxID=1919 RepID=A0A7J0CRA6_STRMI|nr:hypothetical protein Smic_35920 [Streptomyces microflavus]